MKFILLLITCTLLTLSLKSQTGSLKIIANDSSEHKRLPMATGVILKNNDSSLYRFMRADNAGELFFKDMPAGKYVLMLTYPSMADFMDTIVLKNEQLLDLGIINLIPKAKLLDEVIIKSGAAIRFKGDTTEFAADSFKVKEGATVEDLLKVLPSFSVNSKGEIKVQGKKVDKVLVDGEEFFGDDPTMATQNISSKAVDKIQVYDTKSEDAKLKGDITSSDSKTVNIKLKDDFKKGAFGKINAGSDFNKYRDAKAYFNRFVNKKKLSIFGTHSNVNAGALDWRDRDKLGIGSDDWEYDEINDYYVSYGGNDDFSNGALTGLPKAYAAGALFSNKWDEDKKNINMSYQFNQLNTLGTRISNTKNILSSTNVTSDKTTMNNNGMKLQHSGLLSYSWKLDSLKTISIKSRTIYRENNNNNRYVSSYFDSTGNMRNHTERENTQQFSNMKYDNSINYEQKFKKKDRLLKLSLRNTITDDDNTVFNNTSILFYENNRLDSTGLVDQMQDINAKSVTWGGKISYNEPLTSKLNLYTEYGVNTNKSFNYNNTYNKNNVGTYTLLDTIYSNNFDLDVVSNNALAVLKYQVKKIYYTLGSGLSRINLNLYNYNDHSKRDYNFLRITPQAGFRFNPKQQTSYSLSYKGVTSQPSLTDLQPLRNNTDPMNIIQGNPDLKVGFTHRLSAYYNNFKMLKNQFTYFNAGFSSSQNDIAYNVVVDSKGGRKTTPVNVNGNNSFYFYGGRNKDASDKKPGIGIWTNFSGGVNTNFINGVQNKTHYGSTGINIELAFKYKDKYRLSFQPGVGYNYSKQSVNNKNNTKYFNYSGEITYDINFLKTMNFNTQLRYNVTQKVNGFTADNDVYYWNAWVDRKFLKKKNLKIGLQANDILNRNRGYDRSISNAFISETFTQNIRRYFLLRIEWDFNQSNTKGGSNAK